MTKKKKQYHFKGTPSLPFCSTWVKTFQIFDKDLFAKMKMLLQHREENIEGFLQGKQPITYQFLATSKKYTGRTCNNQLPS